MLTDLLLLARSEIKRIWRSSRYWLRLLGFEPDQSRLLYVYVFLFWMGWLYTMWSYAADQVLRFHDSVNQDTIAAIVPFAPLIILAAQIAYLAQVLRDPPLKMAAGDLQYVATAPVSRGAIALVQFVVKLTFPVLVVALAGTLAAMFLSPGYDRAAANRTGLWAFAASLLIAAVSAALCWSIALLKQNQTRRLARWRFWLALPLVIAAAIVFPQAMLIPGQVWVNLIETGTAATVLLPLIGGLIVALSLLAAAGDRLHMATVIADSQLYARIQKLGLMGRVIASDVIARIRDQARLSRKRRLHRWFPTYLSGTSALVGHSAVTLIRLSPGAVIRLFFNGSILASIVLGILSIGDAPSLPSWLIVYFVLFQMRPRDVVRDFRSHADHAFMQQWMPPSNVRRFFASTALPFAITALGMLATLLVQQRVDPLVGSVLALSCLLTLALCLAVESVRVKDFLVARIAYEYSLLAAGVAIIFGGYLVHSLWGAAAASVIVNIVLLFVLSDAEMQ